MVTANAPRLLLLTRSSTPTSHGVTSKAEESKERSKKELAAFIKKQVSQGVQKELASMDKKCKALSDNELDLNAIDLDSFSYTKGVAGLDLSDNKVKV